MNKHRASDLYKWQERLDLQQQGGLAHLARALAWHARGDQFESGILHQKAP